MLSPLASSRLTAALVMSAVATLVGAQSSTAQQASTVYACVVVADYLNVDDVRTTSTTFVGVDVASCELAASAQAKEGFRLIEGERVYYYPANRVLRLEVRPIRGNDEGSR